jgi:DNA-binding NarL/FixJ family response regulator
VRYLQTTYDDDAIEDLHHGNSCRPCGDRRTATGSRAGATCDVLAGLTKREVEVVRLAVTGLANKEIATQLFISTGTVKIHLHHVYEKLGLDNRVALILFAQEKGIV